MSLPAYPKYKPSAHDWIGTIPCNWESIVGRQVFAQVREPAKPTDEQLTASQKYGVIPQKMYMELEDQKVTLALGGLDNFKHVDPGDFVISLRSFQGGIEHSRFSGCVSPAYTVLHRRHSIDAAYFAFLLKSDAYIGALQSITDGIRDGKNISYEQFSSLPLPVPPLGEQTAIAAFLDRETTKIDTVIEQQKRLIELLKEKRQAVISHAVTRGLNPGCPMKESGIEWLGKVPEHWKIEKLSWHFRAYKGKNGQLLTKEYCGQNSGDYPVYSGQTENNGIMGLIDSFEFDFEDSGVLFSTTVGAKAMTLRHIKGKFSLSQNCMIIQATTQSLEVEFAFYHFQPLFGFNRSLIPDHMQASFRMDDLYQYRFALPPMKEQVEISLYLRGYTGEVDALITEAEVAISLLQERRAALISAAVTGKIDVRHLVETREAAE